MDLKLSNHVFNALKQHAYSEERRSARLHEKKEHSTAVSIPLTSLALVEEFMLETNVWGEKNKTELHDLIPPPLKLAFQVSATQVTLFLDIFLL